MVMSAKTLDLFTLQNILLLTVLSHCWSAPVFIGQQILRGEWQREKRSSSLWGGKPPDKTCLNFCMFARCHNGNCIMNSDTCMINCVCFEGFTGRRCTVPIVIEEDVVSPPTNTTFGRDRTSLFSKSPSPSTEIPRNSTDRTAIRKTVKLPGSVLGHVFGALTTLPSIKNPRNLTLSTKQYPPDVNASMTKRLKSSDINESLHTSTVTSTESSTSSSQSKIKIATSVTKTWDFMKPKNNKSSTGNTKPPEQTQGSYQSPYLDKCKENCINNTCVAINGSFHCLPEQHYCKNGFICEHGVCDPDHLTNQRYKCLCEPGYIGDTCSKECDLDCGKYGVCVLHGSRNVCACDSKHTGKRCEKLIPIKKALSEETWYWYVVGVCIACLVLLMALIIFLPYWMWRKRWLFIRKIVHYFQHYEEDDGKLYDAFISYKSSKEDEDFVLHQLYPKLEVEMGFKLCMHFRDFTPGDVIANNIIRAIENSRRTIMVLSPNYVDSEWCRMEYQKAQHEMLKLKHKIIPIVFKDISQSSNIDKNLKTILKTVTYLEWPNDDNSKKLERFWKQLTLSLPKKHPNAAQPTSPALPTIITPTAAPITTSFISPSNESSTCHDDTFSRPCETESENSNEGSNVKPSESTIDNTTNRLRKLMKDIVKLKITNNSRSFTRLSAEGSIESCTPTPVSSTPSPGMCIGKDQSPLLSKKKNFYKHSKSSTWSERTLQSTISESIFNRSLREKEQSRRIDIIPNSPDNFFDYSVKSCLPDICPSQDGSYLNILCEPESSSINDSSKHLDEHKDCNTCVMSQEADDKSDQCLTCMFPREVENTQYENIKILNNSDSNENNSGGESINFEEQIQNGRNTSCSTCVFPCEVNNANYKEFSSHVSHVSREGEGNVNIQTESINFRVSDENKVCENNLNISSDSECVTCVYSRLNNSIDVNANVDQSNIETEISCDSYNIPTSNYTSVKSCTHSQSPRDRDKINCNSSIQRCILLDNSQSESDSDAPRAPIRTKKLKRKTES